MLFDLTFSEILVRIPVLLLSLSIHEFSHGFAAYKLGDSTAKYDGRLSLNPLRHIDLIGFICMLLFRFGWAKPVMTNPRHFKNPKRDMAITALAGPVSNFILVFISFLIFIPVMRFNNGGNISYVSSLFLIEIIIFNLSLGVFNLLPIPPLDGSKIFAAFLPHRFYPIFTNSGRVSFILLILLIYSGALSYIISPLINLAFTGIYTLVEKIYFFL